MKIITEEIRLATKGNPDLVNITDAVSKILSSSKLTQGMMSLFVVGSTAAITTFEYEPGLIEDIRDLFEKLIPQGRQYHHDETWHDANGFSHLRASLQGPSLIIPFKDGKLLLGQWQQVVLAEFDNRQRKRQVIVQLIGE
ncbi:MAG: YjbQ family protein [Candidatus Omnitrophota bacterium]|jgi:secondary thiamine-phosphate synthase enzyme|nr:MAG: YjbQ family protein [Candidatus Omnitrophota bacterium]